MKRNFLISLLAIFILSTIYFLLSFLGGRKEVQSLTIKNETQRKIIDSLIAENLVIQSKIIKYETIFEDCFEILLEQKNNIDEIMLNTE
jgi:hypothetical protein